MRYKDVEQRLKALERLEEEYQALEEHMEALEGATCEADQWLHSRDDDAFIEALITAHRAETIPFYLYNTFYGPKKQLPERCPGSTFAHDLWSEIHAASYHPQQAEETLGVLLGIRDDLADGNDPRAADFALCYAYAEEYVRKRKRWMYKDGQMRDVSTVDGEVRYAS